MRRHCSSPVLLPCVALALLLAACSQSSAAKPPSPTATATATATATPTTVQLPTFSDWRIAYLDARAVLHAVSLDGKTDLAGPQLAGLVANGIGVVAAGFSPGGHLLAYAGDTYTAIMDVTDREATGGLPAFAGINNMFWSPDGSALEADDNVGGIMVEHLPDGKVTSLASAATAAGVQGALGWIDATHLAVTLHPLTNNPGAVPTQGIGALDITTGRVRTLATFSSRSLGTGFFSLAPDGTAALFYNQPYREDPSTPQVDAIDTATGAVMPLPRITSLIGSNTFPSLAWRPGTHIVAVSVGFTKPGAGCPRLQAWGGRRRCRQAVVCQ